MVVLASCCEKPCCGGNNCFDAVGGELDGVSRWPPNDEGHLGKGNRPRPTPVDTGSESQGGRSPATSAKKRADTPTKKRRKEPRCCSFGPRLSEDEMLNTANWCCYCCCIGCASSITKLRPCECAYHALCCSQGCSTTACLGAGLCKIISDLWCCTLLCQCPPRKDRACCICCSRSFGKAGALLCSRKEDDGEDFEFDNALDVGKTPCFCCCCGIVCRLKEPVRMFAPSPLSYAEAEAQHLYKCCCCEMMCTLAGCRCCGAVCSAWCCLGQCRCPPERMPPNPGCACLGFRCQYAREGPPKQQEMS